MPALPVRFEATPTDAALRVEVVDAVTGQPAADAAFRWVRPLPGDTTRGYEVPRGVHWFEVEGPGHLRRRESWNNPTPSPRGTLRVPVFPRLQVVLGQLRSEGKVGTAVAGDVEAPASASLAPLFPARTASDAEGNFTIVLRATADAPALAVHVLGRSISVPLAGGTTSSFDAAPHFGIARTQVTLGLELTETEAAALGWHARFARDKARYCQKRAEWRRAVDAGLAWLVAHQDEDGRWDADGFMKHDTEGEPTSGPGNPLTDVGVTGLALLALLGDGHSAVAGQHAPRVRRAVEWLLRQRIENDVLADPTLGVRPGSFIHQHCIATLALCEACAAGGGDEWRPTIQRVVDYIEQHRNPYGVWSYEPRSGENRLASTFWAGLALDAAKRAGFAVTENTAAFLVSFVLEMTDPRTGRIGYLERGGLSGRTDNDHGRRFPAERNEAMTAAGLVLLATYGHSEKTQPGMGTSLRLLAQRPPQWTDGSQDFYAWSLGAHATWLAGAGHWDSWATALAKAVLPAQRKDGRFAGSWDPIDAWGEQGGRVYSTAMLVLALQCPWRLQR